MTLAAPDGARAEVRSFFYGDAGAVADDLAGVDTIRVAPRGTPVDWPVKAQLITDNNLIAIILTDDDMLRYRIRNALMQVKGNLTP